MAFDKLAIIVGQLLPGTAGVEVMAQRRKDERLKLGGGNAADRSGRLGLSSAARPGRRNSGSGRRPCWYGLGSCGCRRSSNRRPLRIAGEPRSRQRRATAWAASLPCTASNSVGIENGLVLTTVNLAPVDHLADIEAVLEQMGERAHAKAAPADGAAVR